MLLLNLLYATTEKIGDSTIGLSATVVSTSQDMSLWGIFLKSEFIIQVVIAGLILASIWSWTIIIDKTRRLKKLEAAANAFEEMFWSSSSLDALFERINNRPTDPLMAMFYAAMVEWRHSISKGATRRAATPQWGLEQRIDRVMQLVINREISALERHSGFLASLGSNGVVIGLFGTVLGIIHRFQLIVTQQNASLEVIAPDIAEALFVTAIGLIAAIPAAIAYNSISTDINRYANRLESFANEFNSIVSRQLEE
ncbi:MAG: protein TolQ [Holosporales bacterium]|jgi:biopolymer transport protein TolQ|nr:protein TolQ [Holosporales bacterium]